MSTKKSTYIILALIITSFIAGFYFFPHMPEKMASHWNIEGVVDRYTPRFLGVYTMPSMVFVLFLLFLIIPKIDPLKANIEIFRRYYNGFIVTLSVFLSYVYALSISWNLGLTFDMTRFILPAVGGLLYYISVLLGHAERNWFIGIRTPWTLSNENVWKKTNKLGSKLFKGIAALTIVGVLIPNQIVWIVITPAILVILYVIIYSYLEYQKETK
ncbi:hypothetical protein COU49_00985 [Candidatus Nomurabacteria bacterium CG10_big_fil_rev_8_21_14_0_10_35_16]|uniref:DUF1648 domain-containing protein n=1 Tax=Candidatus Nomurabacteria bacterium CG10_big_fil_rev_8_21_14_0_10_35_16 TaxID=1974731 RepID=A0A2H0TDF2_9BACT|nr:MAG: hypothetical protein COU49_00985 [Candidatus Nomurabacteria bacterium CG10_big_fil_rev_8_21_14_0_10_35_16]